MVNSLKRIALSLLIVGFASWVYALAVVPLVEGEAVERARKTVVDEPGVQAVTQADFAHYFPPDFWERSPAKVLRVDAGHALFQEWDTAEDGHAVLVTPFTLILQQKDSESEGKESSPIILRAPEGAKLEFDTPFTGGLGPNGRLEQALLMGEVTIYRTQLNSDDEPLLITTQNIQISADKIRTPHAVSFQIGQHHGKGKNLSIQLLTERASSAARVPSVRGIQSLELMKLDYLSLEVPAGAASDVSLSGDSATGLEASGASQESPSRIEIRCSGSMLLEMLKQEAVLRHNVHLRHYDLATQRELDTLDCQVLTVDFESDDFAFDTTEMMPSSGESADVLEGESPGSGKLVVKRLSASGTPAVLASPHRKFQAQAEHLSYDPVQRHVSLRDRERVLLIHKDLRFEAPTLDYNLGPEVEGERTPGIGTAISVGPGRLTRLPGTDHSGLEVTWEEELQLRPHDGLHALSLYGNPRFQLGNEGEFYASELHVWLAERQDDSVVDDNASESVQPSVEPVKMLAQGVVHVESPRLIGDTRKLEVFWTPPETRASAAVPGGGLTSGGSAAGNGFGSAPGQGSSGLGSSGLGGSSSEPATRRLHVKGDFIRARLRRNDEDFEVQEVTIDGNARLIEQDLVSTQEKPLEISGRLLQVTGVGDGSYSAYVVTDEQSGQVPALSARGLKLFGPALQMDQSRHRMWMDGAGIAQLTQKVKPNQTNRLEGPVEIRWSGNLNFDGQLIRMTKDVVVVLRIRRQQGELSTIEMKGEQLDIRLTDKVDFSAQQADDTKSQIDVETLILSGTVTLSHWEVSPGGEYQAVEHLQTVGAGLDYQSGHLLAGGPGVLQSVRLGARKSLMDDGAVDAGDSERLTHTRIEFTRSIEGNIHEKRFSFLEKVQVYVDAAKSWDDWPSREQIRQSSSAAYLSCDELQGAMVFTSRDSPDRWVAQALGNAYARGRGFEASASRMVYEEGKDLLTLEALDRDDAELTWQARAAAQRDHARARVIRYWKTDQRVEVDGVQSITSSGQPIPTSNKPNRGGPLGGYRR